MTAMAASRSTARRRVLCVDDNPDVLEFQKCILEHSGYEVLLASNGADGISLAEGRKVDLALLDYEMPLMMGSEVAQRLRDILPALPIIIVSGSDLPEEVLMFADCCVSKTKMGQALIQEVNRLLGSRRSGKKLQPTSGCLPTQATFPFSADPKLLLHPVQPLRQSPSVLEVDFALGTPA
jgi:CheY-like chemotaxis protein